MSTSNRFGIRNYSTNALIAILFFFLGDSAIGQILDLTVGKPLEEAPFFNEAWIKKHRISTIRCFVEIKDDGLPIRSSRTQITYRFDERGKFNAFHKIIDKGDWIDSASIKVKYNSKDLLVFKRERDLFGVHYYSYEYRKDGSLFREVYTRPQAFKMNPKVVFLEEQTFENRSIKRTYKNANNKEFKNEIFNFNAQGKPIYYRDKKYITGMNSEKEWEYENGQLSRLKFTQHYPSKAKWVYAYTYENDRLSSYDVSQDGKLKLHHELLYKDEFIDVILTKENETNRITITRFTYEYFE